MPHKNMNDPDTDTGLPRKLGWKVAGWSLGTLQAITIVLLGFILNSILDLRERMVRVEIAFQIRANAAVPNLPAVAVKVEPLLPMP